MHFVLHVEVLDQPLVRRLRDRGVAPLALSKMYITGAQQGLVIGFANVRSEEQTSVLTDTIENMLTIVDK